MTADGSRPRWSATTKSLVAATLIVLTGYLLVRFWVVVTPLLIAAIVAYILSPVVLRLEQRFKMRRWLATLLVYLVVIAILLTVPALIIPVIIERLGLLGAALEDIVNSIEATAVDEVTIGQFTFESSQIVDQLVAALRGLIEPVFGRTLGLAFEVISSVVTAVFVIVISFYLVKDSLKLRRWVRSLPPPRYREDFRRLALEVNEVWSSFFRGQLILALVVGTGFTLAGYILGLPFALAMGVLAGLMEFVPSVGHTIWITIASILVYFLGSSWIPVPNWVMMVIVVGLHLVFAQFDLNYLIPRIIGRRVNLHPLVIILGIIAGASVAGVMGVVLAAPTIATARVLGRYLFANLFDEDPFPQLLEGGS